MKQTALYIFFLTWFLSLCLFFLYFLNELKNVLIMVNDILTLFQEIKQTSLVFFPFFSFSLSLSSLFPSFLQLLSGNRVLVLSPDTSSSLLSPFSLLRVSHFDLEASTIHVLLLLYTCAIFHWFALKVAMKLFSECSQTKHHNLSKKLIIFISFEKGSVMKKHPFPDYTLL